MKNILILNNCTTFRVTFKTTYNLIFFTFILPRVIISSGIYPNIDSDSLEDQNTLSTYKKITNASTINQDNILKADKNIELDNVFTLTVFCWKKNNLMCDFHKITFIADKNIDVTHVNFYFEKTNKYHEFDFTAEFYLNCTKVAQNQDFNLFYECLSQLKNFIDEKKEILYTLKEKECFTINDLKDIRKGTKSVGKKILFIVTEKYMLKLLSLNCVTEIVQKYLLLMLIFVEVVLIV